MKLTKAPNLLAYPFPRRLMIMKRTNDVSLSHPEKNDLPVGEWVRRIFQGWHIVCTRIKYNPKAKEKSSKLYAQKSHFFNVNA